MKKIVQFPWERKDKEMFYGVCRLVDETDALNQQNDILIEEIDSISIKLKDCDACEDDYEYLKKQKKADVQKNQDLKMQVKDLRLKLVAKTQWEEKCEVKKKVIGDLLQSNQALEQEIVSLNLKLKDTITSEHYEKLKNQKIILKKQNILLQKKVEEAQKKQVEQNQLKEKLRKSEEKLKILGSNNKSLVEQLEELKNKTKFGYKIRNEFTVLKEEVKIMTSHSYELQDKISELQDQYTAEKYWIDEYQRIKRDWNALDCGNAKLQAECLKIGNELKEITALKQKNASEIHSTVPAVEDENVFSCSTKQKLIRGQRDSKDTQGKYKKCKAQSDVLQEISTKAKIIIDKLGNAALKFASEQKREFLGTARQFGYQSRSTNTS